MPKLDKGLKWYIVLVFALSFIVAGIVYFGGGLTTQYAILAYVFMYTPLISAVIVRKFIIHTPFFLT